MNKYAFACLTILFSISSGFEKEESLDLPDKLTASDASYRGGVYKVTSSTTAEALADQNDTWFYTPYKIAVDSENNLILSSLKYASESESYPSLSLYDGSSWKTISGDFSDGADPIALGAISTDIYYVYGDASSENTSLDPTQLLSGKFSK